MIAFDTTRLVSHFMRNTYYLQLSGYSFACIVLSCAWTLMQRDTFMAYDLFSHVIFFEYYF